MITDSPAPLDQTTDARLALVRPLFGAGISLGAANPLGALPDPFPQERACLSPSAVEKRRREFAAGRAAAHRAMQDLGRAPCPIVIAKSRAPIWPKGLTGSITHTHSCALAAVASTLTRRAIGIDVEEDTPLKGDLRPAICSAREQDWLSSQDNPGQMAKLIFSAKEAAYKCQYTVSEQFFGFDGMELEIEPEDVCETVRRGRFIAAFTVDRPPFRTGARINGAYVIGEGIIFTTASLEA